MAIRAAGRLRAVAAAAPVPIYAAIGRNARRAVEDLFLDPGFLLQASAKHASLLLVAGEIREEDRSDLQRLHDQLPHPRATLWWKARPVLGDVGEIIPTDSAVAGALLCTYRQLLLGQRQSESDLLPNEPPAPWQGKGDHGQGGEGMMGGKPYGRPMAMTDGDLRDGLALDAFTTSVGPFLPMLPPGLKLELTLQGDVIQKAQVQRPPFALWGLPAQIEPLRLIARLLRLLGLSAQSERFIRADRELQQGRAPDMRKLQRLLDWSGAFQAIPPGLGETASGDVRLRLRNWWEQAMRQTGAHGREVRHQARPVVQHGVAQLTDMLSGLEWNEAMLVINSLDGEAIAAMCSVPAKNVEIRKCAE
jgi:hypothetical protein